MNFFTKKAPAHEVDTLRELIMLSGTEIGKFRAQLSEVISINEKLQAEVSALTAVSADTLRRHQLKTSDEPWIDIIGSDVDAEKGLQLTMDWNDAFIEQLRAQGYKGTTEQALVAQYLLLLSNNLKGDDK